MWQYIRFFLFAVLGYCLAIIKSFHYVSNYIVVAIFICAVMLYVSGVKEGSQQIKDE